MKVRRTDSKVINFSTFVNNTWVWECDNHIWLYSCICNWRRCDEALVIKSLSWHPLAYFIAPTLTTHTWYDKSPHCNKYISCNQNILMLKVRYLDTISLVVKYSDYWRQMILEHCTRQDPLRKIILRIYLSLFYSITKDVKLDICNCHHYLWINT